MSAEVLRNRIRQSRERCEKSKVQYYYHLEASLNKLIELDVIQENNIQFGLCEDLEKTLSLFESILRKQGKDPRSHKSRVRRLAEYYSNEYKLDSGGMTFSELLQAAALRMYGDKLHTGPVRPDNQAKIHASNQSITYRQIARDIIIAGNTKDPSLWDKVDLVNSKTGATMGSASKVLRDYFTGESRPTERVSDERLYFIEEFLHLEKGSLLIKVKRRIDHKYQGRAESERSNTHKNRAKHQYKKLNTKLQFVFDEYSNYKIKGIQPIIRNITDELRQDPYFKTRATVREKEKWTGNTLEKIGSQTSFHNNLLAFLNYCIDIEKIHFDEVGTEHLSDPELIHRMCQNAGRKKGTFKNVDDTYMFPEDDKDRNCISGTVACRILNWVYRGAQAKGYLRFCAKLESKNIREHFFALDYILEEYEPWHKLAGEGVNKKPPGSRGKERVLFLTNLHVEEAMENIHKATNFMIKRAQGYQIEANASIKFAKKAKGPVSKNNCFIKAASCIKDALKYAQTAIINEISFVNCPRAETWTTLKYYPTATAQNSSYASLTFHRQRNRFRLYTPVYGASLIDVNKGDLRGLKNSDSEEIVPIDVELPERLTPLIKSFLSIRQDYIEMNLERFGGAEPDEVEMLMPWRSVRADALTDKNEILRRKKFIQTSSALSNTYYSVTYSTFSHIMPDTKQHGIYHHGMRHLVAETHLKQNPGDYSGAAAKLNDTTETIIEKYGDNDRARAMKRVAAEQL